jgi:hypothetical protein
MIRDALQYIVGLATEPVEIEGKFYHRDKLKIVDPPLIEPIEMKTLEGFADFVNSIKTPKEVFVCIKGDDVVLVRRELVNDYRRDIFAKAPIPVTDAGTSRIMTTKLALQESIKEVEIYL